MAGLTDAELLDLYTRAIQLDPVALQKLKTLGLPPPNPKDVQIYNQGNTSDPTSFINPSILPTSMVPASGTGLKPVSKAATKAFDPKSIDALLQGLATGVIPKDSALSSKLNSITGLNTKTGDSTFSGSPAVMAGAPNGTGLAPSAPQSDGLTAQLLRMQEAQRAQQQQQMTHPEQTNVPNSAGASQLSPPTPPHTPTPEAALAALTGQGGGAGAGNPVAAAAAAMGAGGASAPASSPVDQLVQALSGIQVPDSNKPNISLSPVAPKLGGQFNPQAIKLLMSMLSSGAGAAQPRQPSLGELLKRGV